MGLYTGSFLELTNTNAATVAVVDTTGTQIGGFDSSRPATSALTTVPASITSVTLLAANPARRRFMIFNNSSKTLTVAFAATASTAAFTLQIGAFNVYDGVLNDYTGVVSGIWPTATGNAQVTEITT